MSFDVIPRATALDTPSNGLRASITQENLQVPRAARILTFMKQASPAPRWVTAITHGLLVITLLGSVVTISRMAGRTEEAVSEAKKVPELQASINALSAKLDEVLKNQDKAIAPVVQRIEETQRQLEEQKKQTAAIALLTSQVSSLTNQQGSIWALEQSNSNSIHELKGTVNALNARKEK